MHRIMANNLSVLIERTTSGYSNGKEEVEEDVFLRLCIQV